MRVKDLEKRETIKQETFAMVAEQGLAGLKMAHLAKRVGVSPSTVYVYFKDKEDLVLTLFMEVTQSLVGEIVDAFDEGEDFDVNLRRAWFAYMDYLYEHFPAIMFHEAVKNSSYYATLANQMKDDEMVGLEEIIRSGQEQGKVKDFDEKLMLASLDGMSIKMTEMFVRGGLERSEEQMENCFRLICDSIKA